MDKREALRYLEMAFRDYYWATGVAFPTLGILCINLSEDGCDLQYLGVKPNIVVDWPTLFGNIARQLEASNFTIDHDAAVVFEDR